MAAPTILWKQHLSVTSVAGTTISTLSLGTVTANKWSANKCISVYVDTTAVSNLKLWLADSDAVVNGSPVSLGNASRPWDFHVKTFATMTTSGVTANLHGTGSMNTAAGCTLATNYRVAPNNSLGAGKSLGGSTNSSVGIAKRSKLAMVSVKPHASAYDGEHTGFAFQVGYDFV